MSLAAFYQLPLWKRRRLLGKPSLKESRRRNGSRKGRWV